MRGCVRDFLVASLFFYVDQLLRPLSLLLERTGEGRLHYECLLSVDLSERSLREDERGRHGRAARCAEHSAAPATYRLRLSGQAHQASGVRAVQQVGGVGAGAGVGLGDERVGQALRGALGHAMAVDLLHFGSFLVDLNKRHPLPWRQVLS